MPEYEVWRPPDEVRPDGDVPRTPVGTPTHTSPRPTLFRIRLRELRAFFVLSVAMSLAIAGWTIWLRTHGPHFPDLPGAGAPNAPFTTETFYPDGANPTFKIKSGGVWHVVTFQRLSAEVLDGAGGCTTGRSEAARAVLDDAHCIGRIVTRWRTTDGIVVTGQVLKFADEDGAITAASALEAGELAPTPSATTPGRIEDRSVYVVVTTLDHAPEHVAAARVSRAVGYLQAEALVTIIWL